MHTGLLLEQEVLAEEQVAIVLCLHLAVEEAAAEQALVVPFI